MKILEKQCIHGGMGDYAAFSVVDGITCANLLRLRLILFFGEGFRFHMVTSSRKTPSVCQT